MENLKITRKELEVLIKEGVEKIHKENIYVKSLSIKNSESVAVYKNISRECVNEIMIRAKKIMHEIEVKPKNKSTK